jgi:site-specific DNA-adenine methylase
VTLEPPVSYQGGKTRIADAIADLLLAEFKPGQDVYDLCCGCGAVSIALVRKGLDPKRIVMVDSGPWGAFWEMIGAGTFDVDYFRDVVGLLPKDPRDIHAALEALSKTDASRKLSIYMFPLLQAGSFGGKPVSIDGSKWVVHGFRDYWVPTETSNRRSHVNPMMPMPETLLGRVVELASAMRGVRGFHKSMADVAAGGRPLSYIDPPYLGLTDGYAKDRAAWRESLGSFGRGAIFDVTEFARELAAKGSPCLVSESKPLGKEAIKLAGPRAKGGVSGKRAKAHEEWVTWFRPGAST